MPAKNPKEWENRRVYIVDSINAILKEKGLSFKVTLSEIERGIGNYHPHFVYAKQKVALELLFVDYRSISNMLKPYHFNTSPETKKTNKQQLSINF